MKLARPLVASVLIFGMSTSGFAGDLHDSIAKAAHEQAQTPPPTIDKAYLIPGAALFVAGMGMTFYGWLRTSGGEFVGSGVSKESKTELGGAGLAVAGVGGTILFLGWRHAKRAPSISVGPGRFEVSKRIAW